MFVLEIKVLIFLVWLECSILYTKNVRLKYFEFKCHLLEVYIRIRQNSSSSQVFELFIYLKSLELFEASKLLMHNLVLYLQFISVIITIYILE